MIIGYNSLNQHYVITGIHRQDDDVLMIFLHIVVMETSQELPVGRSSSQYSSCYQRSHETCQCIIQCRHTLLSTFVYQVCQKSDMASKILCDTHTNFD